MELIYNGTFSSQWCALWISTLVGFVGRWSRMCYGSFCKAEQHQFSSFAMCTNSAPMTSEARIHKYQFCPHFQMVSLIKPWLLTYWTHHEDTWTASSGSQPACLLQGCHSLLWTTKQGLSFFLQDLVLESNAKPVNARSRVLPLLLLFSQQAS